MSIFSRGSGRPRRAVSRALAGVALLSVVGVVAAQGPGGWGRGRFEPAVVRRGLPDQHGGFTFCRLLYTSSRWEAGGQGWSTDYPLADNNFMLRLSQFTNTAVSRWKDGEYGYVVVRATDPNLFRCPFLFGEDTGTMELTDAEVGRLREYLLKGGFLWVDDFWGDRAWDQWASQIKRVLPEYEIVDMPMNHPLLSVFYNIRSLPQVPSIQFWRRNGGETSERGEESAVPDLRAIFDDRGRLLVLMSHDTDIADGWEREAEDHQFLDSFSPHSYAVAVNVAVWAMSH